MPRLRNFSFQDCKRISKKGGSNIDSRSKALFIAKSARDKKAQDSVILDISKLSNITDYFIILSGNSARQVRAITDYVIEKLKQRGNRVWHIEGYQYALWVLLDYGDAVVHIFQTQTRDFYGLERLWADAPQMQIELEKDGTK